jgi:hypothetical protein
MNKADIICRLHEIADFHLLGGGAWPANRESIATYWEMLKELGLYEDAPEFPGSIRATALGLELNVDLMTTFAGAWDIGETAYFLERNGFLEREEESAIWEVLSREEAERLVHQYVLRAYLNFSNHSRFLN